MRTLLICLIFCNTLAFGFSNAYLSFEQPEGWKCELVQKAWFCQSENPADRQEALVMSIASLATEWDTIENYEEYLKGPKPILGENGEPLAMSEVSYARKRNINGQVWVDAYHHNSELPGFWTRYTATIHESAKSKLAILVTYVVSDERRQQFAPQFERMVSSLKPNSEFDLNTATKQGDVPVLGSERLGGAAQGKLLSDRLKSKKTEAAPPAADPEGDSSNLLLGLMGAGAIIALILLRKRRRTSKG